MLEYFFNTTQFVIFTIAASSTLILLLYYITLFRFKKTKSIDINFNQGISVIIAAKNERKNLIENLPLILNQSYENFEVIVVNDGSYDGTKEILNEMALIHNNLKPVHLEIEEQYQKGKKFALTIGIKAAKNEHLLFTDADCKPKSNLWIKHMAREYTNNDIILGVAPLNTKSNLLGSFVSYETFHTAIQYLGYAKQNKAYMGVGRNLGYKKSIFFENKGFASHQHIMSGDDDLFIQEVSSNKKIGICYTRETLMYSNPPASFGKWIKQKVRHMSTSSEYRFIYKLLLGFYSFSQILWFFSIIGFLLLYPNYWYLVIGFALIKWLVQWIIFGKFALKISAKRIAYFLPVYDILYTFYLILFGVIKPFAKPKTWN
ncbi:MAG: glycosyltransferase [Bacteroidetes bacterium]|nr:glycosyltransferase [Bacteroidota bacterium]